MNDYKITQQVKRKSKRFAKPLSIFMVVMAVVLVILAIIFDTGLRADHSCDPGKAAPENSTYADDAGHGSDRTELA